MAFDAFMKIEGAPAIKGETSKKGKEDQIEIYSFSWGASNPVTVSDNKGIAASKVSISSFNIMKKADTASPPLFLACCAGTVYPKAIVTMRKASGGGGDKPGEDYITYTFENLMIESIQWSGSAGGDDTPTESVSFAFTKVKMEYKIQDDKGQFKAGPNAGWDIKAGVKA